MCVCVCVCPPPEMWVGGVDLASIGSMPSDHLADRASTPSVVHCGVHCDTFLSTWLSEMSGLIYLSDIFPNILR